MSTSDNTVKSFALGYNITNAVIDGVVNSTSAITSAASETKQVSTSFFAGIMFAIEERRGITHEEREAPTTKDDAAKREAEARKLREAKEIYARAHAPKAKAKAKAKAKNLTNTNSFGSGPARDASTLFLQIERGACIAGKPGSHREICRSQILHSNRPAGRPPRRLLILIYPPHREAERRFCAVGRPAWMPGEPRWAMDGPWRRAHGAKPARGNLSAAKAVRQGQGLFGSFCGCLTKGTRRKGETNIPVICKCRICTRINCFPVVADE